MSRDDERSGPITRKGTIGLAGLGLLVLVGCGQADDPAAPPSRQVQAIVDMCFADGTAQALCDCSAKTIEASLDPAALSLLIDFAKALDQARTQESKGLAALGAAGNPRLTLALDKVGAAARTCERAAALEAAQVEVAAAEAARQARRASAADRRCPPNLALAPALPGTAVDDVADLRPRMGFEDIKAAVQARHRDTGVKPTL